MGFIYFLVYLFLEILFSYEFMRVFTPIGFFIEILVSAGVGIYIIRTLHLSLSYEMQKVMRREITQEEFLASGIFRMIGAFLLIIPGIFSDILGVMFLLEPFARWIAKKLFKSNNVYTSKNMDDDIIDAEIIEIIEEKKD